VVDTNAFGSGYWDAMAVTWQVGPKGEQNLSLTLMPREDADEPDEDLTGESPASPQDEWGIGFEAPDPLTGGPKFVFDVATGIIYERQEDGSQDDDYSPGDGTADPY
jgi:hypothetical protein